MTYHFSATYLTITEQRYLSLFKSTRFRELGGALETGHPEDMSLYGNGPKAMEIL